MLLNQHVTRERAVVREDHIVFDHTVMSNMAIRQEIPTVTHSSDRANRSRPINCDKFSETVCFADFQICRLPLIFQILRLLPDRTTGVKPVSSSDLYRSAYRDVVLQPTTGSDGHLPPDHAVRANNGIRTNFRIRINDRGRM